MLFKTGFTKTCLQKQFMKTSSLVGAYFVLSLLLSSQFVTAEVFKTVDAEGNVSYSDIAPANKAEESSTVDTSSNANISDSKEKITNTHPDWLKDAQKKRVINKLDQAEQKQQQSQARKNWNKNYKAAKAALKQAKQELSAGVIASEGDFIGRAGGGTRPSEQYFAKQQALELAVEEAKQTLKQIKKSKPY